MSKSLSKNMSLNLLRTVMGLAFPLITYPYITRVLGVENVGKYNFAASIVGYMALLAGFGITSYAEREGARIRDDKNRMASFVEQIFSISLLTTLIAYIVLVCVLLFSGKTSKLNSYAVLILIQSVTVLGTTLGVDWVNTVYEDFAYITVRTIAFQILSIILMFIFVRTSNDLYKYAVISVIASIGASVCNFFYCRKYVRLRPTQNINLKKHIQPLVTFFCSNLTTTIFLNSDQTMLGIMCGDYYVGLYAIAVKIYTILKSVFTSILVVVLPRISNLDGTDRKQDRRRLAEYTLKIVFLIVIPMAIGIYAIAENAVLLVAGPEYLEGISSLKILSVSLLASALASYMTYIHVVPGGHEKILLVSSTVSAAVNLILNFCVIPIWKHNGAAMTTFLAEAIGFIIKFLYIRPEMNYKSIIKMLFQTCTAGVLMLFAVRLLSLIGLPLIVATVVDVLGGGAVYFLALFLMKNEVVVEVMKNISNRVKM